MKNTKKLSTGRIKGYLIQEGPYVLFRTEKGETLQKMVGYVKYTNKVDTNIDVGFIDYYPVTDYLLSKLIEEKTICELEMKGKEVVFHDDKLIIII